MAWGALLADTYGNPWVTPDSTPMSLVQKVVLTPASAGTYALPVNASAPFMVACNATVAGVIFWITNDSGTYNLHYSVASSSASPGTVSIYIFGYVIPQPLPKWGIAIWNASGQCILTNETKVMNPPTGYGTIGSTTDTGYLIDKTITGKWAVIPKSVGLLVGVIFTGGATRPYSSSLDTSCFYNGTTTRLASGVRVAPGDIVQNQGYSNSRDLIYAIDVTNY